MFEYLRFFMRTGLVLGWGLKMCLASPSSDDLRTIVAQTDTESLTKLLSKNPALADEVLDNGVPFMVYAANSGRTSIVELLIHDHACSQSILDKALNGAVSEEHQQVVRVLLDHSANANFKSREGGSTPLHEASLLNNPTIAWMLLRAGADPHVTDSGGQIPLHRCKNAVTAYLLVEAGANINAIDADGRNPLHVFATPRENIDIETVKYLISEGIDVAAKDKEGMTPLDLAKKNGQNELVALLESKQNEHVVPHQ